MTTKLFKSSSHYLVAAFLSIVFISSIVMFLTTFLFKGEVFDIQQTQNSERVLNSVEYLLEDIWLPTFDRVAETSAGNKEYSNALKKKDLEKLAWLLTEEFHQGAVTRGDVHLIGAVAVDKELKNVLASAKEGLKEIGLSKEFLAEFAKREGAERFKRAHSYWKTKDGVPVISIISPLGGLSIKGYIILHANAASPLKSLHNSLQGGVKIYNIISNKPIREASIFDKKENNNSLLTSTSFFPKQSPIMQIDFESDVSTISKKLLTLEIYAMVAQLIALFIVGILTAVVLRAKVLKVLRMVRNKINLVAKGELSSVQEKIDMEDEIGEVNDAVADMSGQLINLSTNLSNAAETLTNIVKTYTSSADEMTATASVVAQNSTECLDSANHAQQTVINGQSILNNLTKGFQTITEVSEGAKVKVESLKEHGSNIQGIVVMIEDIADRINLLALNASIEAARAGDAGRGFAVVADEVRKLADETSKAIGNVDKTIVELRNEVDSTQQGMEAVISAVHEGEDNVHETLELLNNITEATAVITSSIESIATMAEEQSSTLATSNQQINSIKEVSERLLKETQHFRIINK